MRCRVRVKEVEEKLVMGRSEKVKEIPGSEMAML